MVTHGEEAYFMGVFVTLGVGLDRGVAAIWSPSGPHARPPNCGQLHGLTENT